MTCPTTQARQFPFQFLVHFVVLSAAGAGCTHATVRRVARYQSGGPQVQSPAPATGVYKVRYAVAGGEMTTAEDSSRIVRRGEPLGFRTAEDGALIAVAGDEEFVVARSAGAVRRCVWHIRTEKPSQFVRELDKAGKTTVTLGAAAGAVAGLVALEVGSAAVEDALAKALDRECSDERPRHRGHRHRHRRGGPEKPAESAPPRGPAAGSTDAGSTGAGAPGDGSPANP